MEARTWRLGIQIILKLCKKAVSTSQSSGMEKCGTIGLLACDVLRLRKVATL